MKTPKDKFSKQSYYYKKYRPQYPQELYDEILKLSEGREACWDCGTGNGQVAVELSKHFEKVYATDISENQIGKAAKKDNIFYSIERAEKTHFKDNQFDLITVAQAIHWFDMNAFNKEVKRVSKNGSILSVWGYGLLRIDETIDEIIDDFYRNVVGIYWDKERRHIENSYSSINIDFNEIAPISDLVIKTRWTLNHLEGYFNSWSSVMNYMDANDENPVEILMASIKDCWETHSEKVVNFPVFIRYGSIEK